MYSSSFGLGEDGGERLVKWDSLAPSLARHFRVPCNTAQRVVRAMLAYRLRSAFDQIIVRTCCCRALGLPCHDLMIVGGGDEFMA